MSRNYLQQFSLFNDNVSSKLGMFIFQKKKNIVSVKKCGTDGIYLMCGKSEVNLGG
jgi:hypothetical protein